MRPISLDIDLGARGYPIHIGPGLLSDPTRFAPAIAASQVMVVSNDTVAPLYLERLLETLRAYRVSQIILPDGERFKDLATWSRILDALLEQRCARDCTLIALGGGVIGDMTGFAAACYQRGVAFIQVPTTLLAQVDSSVGGKTGINHPAGKNMIGAFHQPVAVIADTETLMTLPERELAAGFAEVIKYGVIRDPDFFAWLEIHCEALRNRDQQRLAEAIERSCRNKAAVVEADEYEAGQRALLNLGHTFGHAIEAGAGYGVWLHGEAVAVGMLMAADLSRRLGWLDGASVARLRRLIAAFGLPTSPPPQLDTAAYLERMAVDKKVLRGTLRLVVPRGIGQAVLTSAVSAELLRDTIEAARAASA